jgi:hypothetical protein
MGRIAADLVDGPVAVNDLGLVSYLDPDWTVDLWGLAARDGLEARRDGPEAFRTWIEAETRSRGVVLAMIYDSWVGQARPPSWRLLAHMTLDQPMVSAGSQTVSFYATAPDRADEMRRALERFATTAPPEVGFTVAEERPLAIPR